MFIPYDKQTINHPNPIARYAHRTRLSRSKNIVMPYIREKTTMLDYGCGDGMFLHAIHNELDNNIVFTLYGYDPYMDGKYEGYEVISDLNQIADSGINIITCLEVCEHLNQQETQDFINVASHKLTDGGILLVTVPIMIGPSLLVKELSRSLLFHRLPDVGLRALLLASFLGTVPPRAENIKTSHRGYDWRVTLQALQSIFQIVSIQFSPFNFLGWYGNSQVLMLFKKPSSR